MIINREQYKKYNTKVDKTNNIKMMYTTSYRQPKRVDPSGKKIMAGIITI